MVHAFLVVVPFAELVLGVLTTLGLFTRWALTLGGLMIAVLVFGTAMRSDWNTVGVQMIYAITYYLLLVHRASDRFSLDALLSGDRDFVKALSVVKSPRPRSANRSRISACFDGFFDERRVDRGLIAGRRSAAVQPKCCSRFRYSSVSVMFVMVRVSVLMLSGTPARYSSSTACSAKILRDAGLQVAGGADLQMNALAHEMLESEPDLRYFARRGRFWTVETRAAFPKRCPGRAPRRHERCDGGRGRWRNEKPECCASMGYPASSPAISSAATRVPRNCSTSLAVTKPLLPIEVAQSTKNEPGIDAAGSDASFRSAIHGGHHLLRRQTALQVQQRREANLGVDHAVGGELLEKILDHQRQRRFVLHQFESRAARASGNRPGWCSAGAR